MNKLAAVVVIYHPDVELNKRIKTYLAPIAKLYVIDNSENSNFIPQPDSKIVYVANGRNIGMAAALNKAATLAISEGFNWLLTMDQDSVFEEEQLQAYLKCISVIPQNNIAVFGVQFLKKPSSTDCSMKKVAQVITSGSILSLIYFEKIGGFDEKLFIDQVDFDYCYKANLLGYEVVQLDNIYMHHKLGTISEYRSLKNFSRTRRSLHSPARLYYMTRNYLYMRDKYQKTFPLELRHSKKDLLNRIKNNLLYGSNRFLVIKNLIAGYFDYRRGKMGRK